MNTNKQTPREELTKILTDLCNARKALDTFYESGKETAMTNFPQNYNHIEGILLEVIYWVADFESISLVDELLNS